jgi:hypothetical protein
MALNPSIPSSTSDQIKLRQRKLNLATNLSDEDIVYRNNRYPFIRLTSGINVSDNVVSTLNLTGLASSGNDLAKRYKLFSSRFNNDFTSGVGYSFNTPTSYGFTSNPNFGFTPPPGITNISVKTLNKGGVRSAEIDIIAHNIFQFNIINALYLKLRYCMLLEWGNNIYYDNNNNYTNNNIDLSNTFLTNGTSLPDMLLAIDSKQKESCGNYDALLGVVKNFTWNMTPEGSYQIKVDLISTGDIAESIQINTVLNFKADPEAPTLTDSNWLNPLSLNRSSLDRIIKRFQAETSWNGSLNGDSTINTDTIAFKSGIEYSYKKTGGALTDSNETYKVDFTNLEASYENYPPGQYYIKLGSLLRIIESFLLEYDTSKTSSPPTIFLDYDYDNNFCFTLTNHLSLDPTVCLIPLKLDNAGKFSKKYIKQSIKYSFRWKKIKISGGLNINTGVVEPEVYEEKWTLSTSATDSVPTDDLQGRELNIDYFLGEEITSPESTFFINKGFLNSTGIEGITKEFQAEKIINNPTFDALDSNGILNSLDSRFRTSDPFKGKLMHVLVNMGFIHKTIEGNIDTNGKLSLTDFLESLLDGIQGALGYINDFVLSYNHTNNSLRILDNTHLANLYDKIDPTVININTLTNLSGSFVLDYSIKSEVFSKQGNALLAGTQDNGNNFISNGTIFTELYRGTTDRVLTRKTNKNSPEGGGVASKELPFLFERYKQYRLKLIQNLDFSLSKDDIGSFKDALQDYFKFEIGQYTKKNNISGDRLIPLNLQLTVDGISGLDLHQVFAVNSLALPSDYAGVASFVIRELTHKINDNGWTTDIGSLTVLKRNSVPVSDIDVIDSYGTNTTILTEFDYIEVKEQEKEEEAGEVTTSSTEGPADGIYISPPRKADAADGTNYVDVSKTINSSSLKKLAAKNNGLYPIKFYTKPGDTSGTKYAKVVGFNGSRNEYESDPSFDANLVSWSYTGKTGFSKSSKLNKLFAPTLTKVAQELDNNGMWNDEHIKSWGAGIIRRDVTPASGVEYGQISAHAFGMAIDINAGQYPLGSGGVSKWNSDFTKNVKTALVHNYINNNFVKVKNGDEPMFWLKDSNDAHHFSVIIKV